LISTVSSCVSNKKIVYLQDKDAKKGHKEFEGKTFDSAPENYILETNDVISVKINHLQLTQDYQQVSEEFDTQTRMGIQHPMLTGFTVDESGFVDLPTVGKVKVAGLDLFQAQKAVSDQAKQFYTNYSVKVFLLNAYVSVLGEVNRPGRYPIYVNEMSVFEALSFAGDATEYADRSEIRVIRNRGDKNQVFVLDLNDEDILANPAFYLQPNDILMVNPLASKKFIRRDPQNIFNAISSIVSVVTLYLLIIK
jgi:polysaccharide export outer membrane protein